MSTSTMNYKKKRFVLGNYSPYSYFHVDKENLILNTVFTSNIYLSYITYGNFDMLLKASPVIEENANDTFIHNLTCVFNYLRDNNINTDELGLGNHNPDMSWIIVTVLLIASFKVPDSLIKNGKKFYDYVKTYVDSKKDYLAMVESKVDTPVSAFNVMLEPLCKEVVDILKNGE